ncbi:MAG: hypothetical protein CMM02_12755 [Rhodopirellula sp.]|nr:hypothetical protein [Rhodopirellula sp.]
MQQSASDFFWDDTNLSLIIGSQTSAGKLTVVGDSSTGGGGIGDIAFSVANDTAFETLKIENDGQIYLGTNSNSRIRSSTNGGGRMVGGQGNTPQTPAFGFFATNGVTDGGGGNGWYRPFTANNQCWSTGGVERMRLTAGGALGIGTSILGAKLHVVGSNAVFGTSGLLVENSAGTEVLKVDNGGVIFGDTRHVAFGTTTLNPCASLEVNSTRGGILFPRMTTTQRNLINSPVDGLMIWNITTVQFEKYDFATGVWSSISGGVFTYDATNNLFGGTGAGASIATTVNSVFAGLNAGTATTGGSWNVFIGSQAGQSFTSPIGVTSIGENSLRDATTSSFMTAYGFQAGMQISGASQSVTAIGYGAIQSHTNAESVVAIGDGANSNGFGLIEESVVIGHDTAKFANPSYSVIIGSDAYNSALNTGGAECVLLGCQAGQTVAGGQNNIMIGFRAEPQSPATNDQLNIGNAIYGDLDFVTPLNSEVKIAGRLEIASQVFPKNMYQINWTLQQNLDSAIGWDGNNGNMFFVAIGQASPALTIDNLTNGKEGATYTLVMLNALGAQLNPNTALHGSDVMFPNGTVPSLTMGSGYNVIEVLCTRLSTGTATLKYLVTNCTYFS